MEELWRLKYLLEPSSLLLIATAILVVYTSARRALYHEREESNAKNKHSTITLDTSQALMIPITSSLTLILMFYLFSSLSQMITLLISAMAAGSLSFCINPVVIWISKQLGGVDSGGIPLGCCRIEKSWLLLAVSSCGLFLAWLVSGHWLLNNLLGVSICVTFVAHIRLPNVKVCALLLCSLFFYDIFWVFYSKEIFGENVMVSVATQQANNPVHTVADKLKLPLLDSFVAKKLDLPVKIIYPRHLLGQAASKAEYIMLGLGDMAIPGMLLALVLCFDYRKSRLELRNYKYIWYAQCGYALGLVTALAAGLLTHSAQPALLYLVPATLGPVMFAAYMKGEFIELWNGPRPIINEKSQLDLA